MANEKRVFGVGKARMGAVGASLTDSSNGIGDVQSASVSVEYQSKDLVNSPEISMFAVMRRYFGGKAEVKLKFKNFDRNVYGLVTGAASSGSGTITLTITATSTPGYFKFELQLVDTDGAEFLITIPNGTGPGLTLGFAIDDFADSDITITAFPDSSNNVISIQSAS